MHNKNPRTVENKNKAQVEITNNGWYIKNGRIRMEINLALNGGIALASLTTGGKDWATTGSNMGVAIETRLGKDPVNLETAGYKLVGGAVNNLSEEGVELVLSFSNDTIGAIYELIIRCFPDVSALEFIARLINRGDAPLPLVYRLFPLSLILCKGSDDYKVFTADSKGRHGFFNSMIVTKKCEFDNWIVLEDSTEGESIIFGGDMGAGVLNFSVSVNQEPNGMRVLAGTNPPSAGENEEPSAIELARGASIETPLVFLALAKGGADDAANEAFRYLKRHVMPEPVPGAPFASCCVWLTLPDSEEILRDELRLAQRVGFDVFYHDATWVEGSSLIPGMNDWAMGLGTFKENTQKFPHGLEDLSRRVRDAGMKFGLWVDPGNVDSKRVASGEIPQSWLAKRNGKTLELRHQSLSPMTQLCLGNPEVVAWIKKNLVEIIEKYCVEWMKWDPSGTITHACDRTDHGHGAHGGAWAAYAGKMEIWSHLLKKFPMLSGFECEPSLRYCRTNPGPRSLLPGGYICEFMTGPMVSPYVWGSLATIKTTDSCEIKELTDGWCSASTLDYSLRQHFIHGFAFGNINGMWSQLLSKAPIGYIEAFRRNLLHFKLYRHLLFCDVWHPSLSNPENWTAIEYVNEDASEAVIFAFRHRGGALSNVVKLKALDPTKTYILTSLNDRPGREKPVTGAALMNEGITLSLPDTWLAKGDGFPNSGYDGQLEFGSDIIFIKQ